VTKQVFGLVHSEARQRALKAVQAAPQGWTVTVSEQTRTAAQNAALWPILHAFATQLKWPVNGEMVYMTEDDWKDVTTAAFRREQNRVAQGIEGGFVMLGSRTSKFAKSQFSEYLDFLNATAAQRGVVIYPEEAAA
jgi:uncharacterized protein YbdZ (MbtH family)